MCSFCWVEISSFYFVFSFELKVRPWFFFRVECSFFNLLLSPPHTRACPTCLVWSGPFCLAFLNRVHPRPSPLPLTHPSLLSLPLSSYQSNHSFTTRHQHSKTGFQSPRSRLWARSLLGGSRARRSGLVGGRIGCLRRLFDCTSGSLVVRVCGKIKIKIKIEIENEKKREEGKVEEKEVGKYSGEFLFFVFQYRKRWGNLNE